MTAPRDPDRLLRAFLREGDDELHDRVYDAVRDAIEQKRQRAVIGPWRIFSMNRFLAIGAAAVALLVVVFIGSQLFGSRMNVGGGAEASPTPQPASPTPAAVTLASGSFTAPLGEFGEAVNIEAVRMGDDVSGTMDISNPAGGEGAYSVNVQCARTTEGGLLLIGGEVTESTYEEFIEDGAYVVTAFASGPPVGMAWAVDVLVSDEVPAPAESCSAFVASLLGDPEFLDLVEVSGTPIEGDLELGE
jgi:hypothetical protein